MPDAPQQVSDVLTFWFEETLPEQWFVKDEGFDAKVRERFLALWERARAGACDAWTESPHGALALVIVLDQFPRNIFRGDPRSFATDAKALEIAKAAIARGFDEDLTTDEKAFLYMPLQHSEVPADQELSCRLNEPLDKPDYYAFAVAHRDIIARFGRFPHRNAVLGRTSTSEEATFLEQPGSSF